MDGRVQHHDPDLSLGHVVGHRHRPPARGAAALALAQFAAALVARHGRDEAVHALHFLLLPYDLLAPLVEIVRCVLADFPGVQTDELLVCPKCRSEGRWDDAHEYELAAPLASASAEPELCPISAEPIALYPAEGLGPAAVAVGTPVAAPIPVATAVEGLPQPSAAHAAYAADAGSHTPIAADEEEGFVPMARTAEGVEFALPLAEAEDAVCRGVKGATAALATLIDELRVVQARRRDAMCAKPEVSELCAAAMADGEQNTQLYDLSFAIIAKRDASANSNYAAVALSSHKVSCIGPCARALESVGCRTAKPSSMERAVATWRIG